MAAWTLDAAGTITAQTGTNGGTMNAVSDLGHATITPDHGRTGEWGTWTVHYVAGQAGIATGGAVRVSLPDRWNQWWRNSGRRVQASEPHEPFYVSARCLREGVTLRCAIESELPYHPDGTSEFAKNSRHDVAGRGSRYTWVIQVTVEAGTLAPGDALVVVFGDRSGGSRGFTPPLWVGSPERLQLAVDPAGTGTFAMLRAEARPVLSTSPGDPVELSVIVPSTSVAGEPADALVVALDERQNPVCVPGLRVHVRVLSGQAAFIAPDGIAAASITVTLDDAARWGSARVRFIPGEAGTIRLRGQSEDGRLFAASNPSLCLAAVPAERLYWGDLHSHSHYSWDGTGTGDDHFRYARDVAGLEVYGNADHGESISPAEWEETIAYNAAYYELGRFVTLVGYEDSFGMPYQHHNVFYRGERGVLIHSRQMTLPEFWAQAVPGEVITIPHHPAGFGRPGGGPRIDWSIQDSRFRTTVEIYSSHGLSEEYAPEHPLSLDIVDFTFQGPADPPSYVQDGWLTGQRMGVIASSDNHWSQPGKDGYGIMAVYAPALTREAVFDAIVQRRTYGTTGARIVLDFQANGVPMGGECQRAPGTPVRIQAEITGTGPLRWLEVLRANMDAQAWRIVHRQWFPGGSAPLRATVDWTDAAPPARALYYLRVRQRDLIHGRVAMAWSSPVWVDEQ